MRTGKRWVGGALLVMLSAGAPEVARSEGLDGSVPFLCAVVMATENRLTHGKISFGDSVIYVMKNCPCEVLLLRLALDDGEE